jgi:hypothetical protein
LSPTVRDLTPSIFSPRRREIRGLFTICMKGTICENNNLG